VRNYDAAETTVTLVNNILPVAWSGPGSGNSVTNPLLAHVPLVSEAVFTNWAQAQIVRDWFSLLSNSPAIGAGPDGSDLDGVVPRGVSISGEPNDATTTSNAALTIGLARIGSGIPVAGWPAGSGYTHYRWRLDGGALSGETPIATPITLTNLTAGPHSVEVSGKLDSGLYQDDPLFGELAAPTLSRTWSVSAIAAPVIEQIALTSSNGVLIQFTAQANVGYRIEYRESLSTGAWQTLVIEDPIPSIHPVTFADPIQAGAPSRFYRLVTQ